MLILVEKPLKSPKAFFLNFLKIFTGIGFKIFCTKNHSISCELLEELLYLALEGSDTQLIVDPG